MVSCRRAAIWPASQAASGGSCICPHWSAKLMVCPATRWSRAVAVSPETWKPAGAESRSRLAPPRAAMPPATASRIG